MGTRLEIEIDIFQNFGGRGKTNVSRVIEDFLRSTIRRAVVGSGTIIDKEE